ncbi:hypothetical protein LTR57_012901 [Friedmanniomyces endolithicus]|nr:hypothetical protein LTR75_010051 [Friedmanniomyces endolithicus]KAK0852262.1 hypothetical protein LTR03_003523 [Friedmanniomyces endolithicus]KAK0882089.1 hypothetical protein LTR87_004044 [Friedmanniomyces endolithicus]KAK0916449.1 hypothetical protein LTR57_012901 [Friedmanniomyces endolithicus]KAK1089051.1 hypothetical protein LTR33_000250 [Friedmanniomyces endolithicus]
MAFTPNILASGKESTSRTVTDTPSTHPTKDKEVAKLLAVVVSHARSAEHGVKLIRSVVDLAYRKHGLALLEDEHVRALMVDGATTALSRSTTRPGLVTATVPSVRLGDISRSIQVLVDRTACAASAVRMLQELTRLTFQRYGRAVIENEHIAMMNVDGTLNWISSSFSDELVQALNVSVAASNDDAAETPEPLQSLPETGQISTTLATTLALASSKRKRKQRGGRKNRGCDPDLPILTSLAAESMVLAKEADLLFLALVYDRLRKRCTAYDVRRVSVLDETRPPPLVFQGRNESSARVNYDPTTRAGLEAVLISAYSRPDRIYSMESALKLFVRWNPALFPELTECEAGRTKYARIAPGSFRSVLDVISYAEGQDFSIPSDPLPRAALCSTLFEIVKARVLDKCPGSDLLQAPQKSAIEAWQKRAATGTGVPATTKSSRKLELCLVIPEPEAPHPNFQSTLLACLVSDDASDAGIEAALEVQLYRMAKKEPQAFPELSDDFAAGSSPPPTTQRHTALMVHADSDPSNHDGRSHTRTSTAVSDNHRPPARSSQGAKAFEA